MSAREFKANKTRVILLTGFNFRQISFSFESGLENNDILIVYVPADFLYQGKR